MKSISHSFKYTVRQSLTLLCLSTLCVLPITLGVQQANAETYSIRTEAKVPVPTDADREIATMLSEIISAHKANALAVAYLKKQGLLSNTQVDPSYFPAIASVLVSEALSYTSRVNENNPEAVHKFKISYDTTRFPDDLDTYFAKNYYQIVLLKRAYEFNQKIAKQASEYLQQIQKAQPAYRQLIRDQKGKKLFDLLKATKWSTEAYSYAQRGKMKKAVEQMEKAIQAVPNYADLHVMKASLLTDYPAEGDEKNDFDQAIQSINKAIELQPKEAIFHAMRGNIYFVQGILVQESEKNFTKAIELDPELGWAYFMRAYAMRSRQYCLEPLKDFKKACELGIKKACKETSC